MFKKVRTRSRFSPVTLETWKMGAMRGLTICVAVLMQVSRSRMNTGILRAPGLLRIFVSCEMVSCRT